MDENASQNDLALFPQRLRTTREQLNISQHELARLCGLSINQISRYELSIREPTSANLVKIARVLNVSIDYLVGLTDDLHGLLAEQDLTAYEREVVDMFRRNGWSGVIKLGAERLAK